MKKNNITQKDLCNHIGVSKQAFTEWKGGRNTSYMKHLPQIADFFNVSVDYLLGKEEQKTNKKALTEDEEREKFKSTYVLSQDDMNFLLELNKMTPEQLEAVKVVVDFVVKQRKKEEQ